MWPRYFKMFLLPEQSLQLQGKVDELLIATKDTIKTMPLINPQFS